MTVLIDKSFVKDTAKIHDKLLNRKIQEAIINIQESKEPRDISNIRKMTGYENYYRIRVGEFRMGMEIIGDQVTLLRFKDRKDIYKVFPPQ